jgi:hypothetical protein
MWVQIALLALIVILLLSLSDKLAELLRTLKRIESRLTLISPLDAEKKSLERDWIVGAHIRDRAIHPDIWISDMVHEEGDLRGAEWKKVRDSQKYRQEHYRD